MSSTLHTRYYAGAVAPSYTAQLESATNITPRCDCESTVADGEASMTGRERKSINYAEPKLNTCVPDHPLSNNLTHPQQKDTLTRSSAHDTCCETHVVGRFLTRQRCTNGGAPPVVTERRRKSQPRLPVDDDEERDGAQVDEEPLAGSRVPTGLMNVNTGTTRWRSTVASNASRRSLIEDDKIDIPCSCDGTTYLVLLYAFFSSIEIMTLRYSTKPTS